jgi:hypothetical protein
MSKGEGVKGRSVVLAGPKSRKRLQFGNVAMRYYEGRIYKTALRLFREEIAHSRKLYEALKEVGYNERQRMLTPRQLELIELYLGEA